jgi:hypothetical protein
VYSTCLFCNHHLGSNEVIETFPVGRRLAFDQRKGRLWVVCRKCEKWNLTPLEERWEAIEDCERRFHDARKRVASDNIGLARLDEGLELVRIGAPQRPEFAAWRYGDQFGRRRTRSILIGTGVGAGAVLLVGAGAIAGVIGGGGYGIWQAVSAGVTAVRRRRIVARVKSPAGDRLVVRGLHAEKTSLLSPTLPGAVPAAEGSHGWGIFLHHTGGSTPLYDDDARRAMALIMPRVNSGGGSRERVRQAVRRIEERGDPEAYLRSVAASPAPSTRTRRRAPAGPLGLTKLDLETRLALEMAVNEENERIALEGELGLLELEWKDAEEIAAIADRLGMPEEVDAQLEELRRRATRSGPEAQPVRSTHSADP